MKQQPEHTVNAQIIDENWFESLYALLKWESVDDLTNWGEPVPQHLAEATDALEGTVYRLSGDEKELYLTGWYSMTYQDGIPVTVPMGSGTIGLCARQQKKQFFLLEEQNFKAYTTGTEINPKCLVTYPLISNHRLTGVLTKEIEEKNKKITSSINYAKNIQEAILPRGEEIGQHLEEFFIIYRCRDVVSGDFYWYAYPDEDTFLIAAVDCTGHGVPGAFMSLIGNTFLNSIVKHRRIKQPGEILKMLNHSVVKTLRQDEDSNSRDGMDIGLINLNFKNKTWKYSGAYRPLVKVSNGKLEEYKGTKAAIGGPPRFQRKGNFEEIKGSWKPGDMVYMYSDGFPDQFSPEGNKFLNKRLKESLVEISSLPCEQQKNALENQFDAWKGKAAQTDDVIMIGIRLG